LIDVAGESRVRITIIEDIAAGTARIILLVATKRKDLAKQDLKDHT
jgi:hypothetical protein